MFYIRDHPLQAVLSSLFVLEFCHDNTFATKRANETRLTPFGRARPNDCVFSQSGEIQENDQGFHEEEGE